MSYFGVNIRKIRLTKKMSQTEFAEIFGITRASVGAYEEGRAEAKIDKTIEIAAYFNISLDQLLSKKITINEISNFNKIDRLLNFTKEDKTDYLVVEKRDNNTNTNRLDLLEGKVDEILKILKNKIGN